MCGRFKVNCMMGNRKKYYTYRGQFSGVFHLSGAFEINVTLITR